MRPAYPDGTPLPTHEELKQERDYFKEEATAEAKARQAAEAKAQAAEARAATLEAELEKLRLLLGQRSQT